MFQGHIILKLCTSVSAIVLDLYKTSQTETSGYKLEILHNLTES